MESAVVADAPPKVPFSDARPSDLSQPPKTALTPPTSEDQDHEKRDDASSVLSDVDMDTLEDDDIGEVEPDHYYEGGKIPVFKPTMDQFRSFSKFVEKIDKYGMKSGIVKVIPPPEWRESLPALEEKIKSIRVKNPIMQEFAGTHGTYTQANIEKQRSYNLPQWKALCEETSHQPPARRGERRRQAETAPKPKPRRLSPLPNGEKRRPGRPRKRPLEPPKEKPKEDGTPVPEETSAQVPPTPTPPPDSTTTDAGMKEVKIETPSEKGIRSKESTPKPRGRQPKSKSISSRRMHNRQDAGPVVDEEAFKNFDHRLSNVDEFTKERCEELEEVYWKTLNYGTPMYGADMPGSLFDDTVTSWNVAKLENLLDVLGTKVPGVNTTYLYLGMWKATFAWHLEDVDLYSINYIHFGAPKQWYSISQSDARRFEAAMKSIWPQDAKNCSQFLRHKTYLISPEKLKSQFNITVNKLVHREGEFVITYPYGYHSGFNIGYNCAESVNFATPSWLEFGRIAKKCDCESDSVWINIAEIERKLRGEPTPEYYTDFEDEEMDDGPQDLPSPPASTVGKVKGKRGRKRKNESPTAKEADGRKAKRIKLKVKSPAKEPCVLCPNDVAYDVLLPTDNGQKAHRLCALYTPETYLAERNGVEMVCNVAGIGKDRLDLRCNFCRSRRGTCFQCSSKKCTRAYHATCAAAAGVQVDSGPMPTFDEDGTEYVYEGYDFRCRYHRVRRGKNITLDHLENNKLVFDHAKKLQKNDVVQAQILGGDVFAGTVIENRPAESSCLLALLPAGDHVEVEWKYILVLDPADSLRPKPSANAKPLPEHLANANTTLDLSNRKDGVPEMDTPFHDPNSPQKWAEFVSCDQDSTGRPLRNPEQTNVDLSKSGQLWFYLGKTSTDARAQFTHDVKVQTHNPRGNFLDLVRPPRLPSATPSIPRYNLSPNLYAGALGNSALGSTGSGKPYAYKPKVSIASLPYVRAGTTMIPRTGTPLLGVGGQRPLQPSPSPGPHNGIPHGQPQLHPQLHPQPFQSRPSPSSGYAMSSAAHATHSASPQPHPVRVGATGAAVPGAQIAATTEAQQRYYQQLQATRMVQPDGWRPISAATPRQQAGTQKPQASVNGSSPAAAAQAGPGSQPTQARESSLNVSSPGSGTSTAMQTSTVNDAVMAEGVRIKQEPDQTDGVASIANAPEASDSQPADVGSTRSGLEKSNGTSSQPTGSEQISEHLTAVDKRSARRSSASPQPPSNSKDGTTGSQDMNRSSEGPAAGEDGSEPFVRSPTFSGINFQSPTSHNHLNPAVSEFPLNQSTPPPSEFPLHHRTPTPPDSFADTIAGPSDFNPLSPFSHRGASRPSEFATINPAALTATPGDLNIDPQLFSAPLMYGPFMPQPQYQQPKSGRATKRRRRAATSTTRVTGALDNRRSSINLPARPTEPRIPPLSHVRSISVGQKPMMLPPSTTIARNPDGLTPGMASFRFPRPATTTGPNPTPNASAHGSSASSGSSTPSGAGGLGLNFFAGPMSVAGWERGPPSARYDTKVFNPPAYEEAERMFARSPSTGRTPVRLSPVLDEGTTTPAKSPEKSPVKAPVKSPDDSPGNGAAAVEPSSGSTETNKTTGHADTTEKGKKRRKEKVKAVADTRKDSGQEDAGLARPAYSPI